MNRKNKVVFRRSKRENGTQAVASCFGVVEDHVEVQHQDTVYVLEKIRATTNEIFFRLHYWTLEGKPRSGSTAQRLGYGQFAPIMPLEVFTKIYLLALERGWLLACEVEVHAESDSVLSAHS
jgi:hypothetical protein